MWRITRKVIKTMLRSYEGYLEKGQFYPIGPPIDTQGRCRVIITVLDESMPEKPDTWAELDKIIAGMEEKPLLENFPRSQLGRALINLEEV